MTTPQPKIYIFAGMPETKAVVDVLKKGIAGAAKGKATVLSEAAIAKLPKGANVIVPILTSHVSVAAGLSGEGQAAAVMVDWKTQTKNLVTLCKKLRARVTVVDAAAIATGEFSGLEKFVDQIDPKGFPEVGPTWKLPAKLDVAGILVSVDPDATKYADALDGLVTGEIAIPRPTGSVDVVLPSKNTERLIEERDELRDALLELVGQKNEAGAPAELELLRDSLKSAMEELWAAEAKCDELDQCLKRKEDNLADYGMLQVLNGSLEKQVAEKDLIGRKREAILSQHLLGGAATSTFAVLTKDLELERARSKQLEDEIGELRGSTSWKMTSPIRSIRRGFSKREGK